MKLNFIQNLSDQVVRENHTLKNQLQRIRQQLKDYEWEMLEVIATMLPQPPLALPPQQTFAEFVRQVRQEMSDHRQLKQHAFRLRQQYEQLQRQQLLSINTISQLKLSLSHQQTQHEQAIDEISQREANVLKQLQWQKEYASRVTDQMSEIKIQKMKLEESKRRTIEVMRQTQNSLLLNFRQQNQEEHMRVQKQLRREIQMRDKTIKEMSSSLAALTDVKNVQNSQEALTGIFKSFQRYETLSAINAELKQQNQQLREQIKSLFNRIISIESETEQIKATQHNTRSQLQRTFMQKQDLQKQLLLKMADIAKHQRDKQAMELYYDQKWNSEYKKVKSKLETTYNAKFDELEKQGKATIQQLKATIKELIKEKEQYAQQIYQLTKLHKAQVYQKLALQQAIKQLQKEIQDLKIGNRENGLMSAEQIFTLKTIFSEVQTKLLKKISQLMTSLAQQLQKIRLLKLQHYRETDEIHTKYAKELKEKDENLARQKLIMDKKHKQDMTQLQKQIQLQIINCQSIRSRVQDQFNITLEQQKAIRVRELALKQQEVHALNERWIDKYCELQRLLVLTRKKHEQQLVFTKNQLSGLLQSDYHLHQQLQTRKEQIKCLEIQVKTLQTQIQDKRTIISQRDGNIASLKKDLQLARLEVQALMANRKQWKNQLVQLQREFLKEFESLRRHTRKQIQHHKDKIRELQDLNHMKSLTRREMAKIQSINTERQSLRSEIHLKQTQNIILNQVKDYYQARLRDSESQLARSDFRTTHAIIARRPKKSRLCNNEAASQRVFDSREPMFQKRRYAITSTKKHYNLSLSKGRLQQSSRKAVQTASSLM